MQNIKTIVALIIQAITFLVGVLTTFGVTLDAANVEEFKQLVTDAGAQLVGIALIVSALSSSAQDLYKKIVGQMQKK